MADSKTYFISYSRADEQFSLELAKKLRKSGANIWMDQIDIQAGERWDTAIEEALEVSDGLLILLSRTSVQSDNVMDEVSYALEEKKDVIPVLIENCEVPFRLRRLQRIDLSSDRSHDFNRLLQALKLEVTNSQTGKHDFLSTSNKTTVKKPHTRRFWPVIGVCGIVVAMIAGVLAARSPLVSTTDGGKVPEEESAPGNFEPKSFEVGAFINDPDSSTNVRSGPGADYSVVAAVVEGEFFYVIPQENEWWPVRKEDGQSGYMHRSRILVATAGGGEVPEEEKSAPGSFEPKNFEVGAFINDPDGSTNIRSGPGADYSVVAAVVEGEFFYVIPQENEWWPVRKEDGQSGYMHRSRVNAQD